MRLDWVSSEKSVRTHYLIGAQWRLPNYMTGQ
jgi:hypothetical protein